MSDLGPFVPERRDAVAAAEIDGEIVLLDTATGALHVLNAVAGLVWSELDGRRDVDTIVAELSAVAGGDGGEVRRDVTNFVEQLAHSGLLSEGPPVSG